MLIVDIFNKYFHQIIVKKTDNGFLQFFRYLIAGGTATVADMTILFILYHLLGVNYLIATALGFVAGVTTNYLINITIVFESTGKRKKEFSLFAIIGIGGLLWTELIMWTLAGNLHFPVMLAKIFAVGLVLNWNFFMRKKFVFKNGEK